MSKILHAIVIVLGLVANILQWVVPIVVGFYAFLASVPIYIIILAAIGAFALTLWGKNQYDIYRERRKGGLFSKSNEEIETVLQKWLLKQGYTIQEDKQENTHFQFIAKNRQNKVVIVTRPKELEWALQLWVDLKVDEKEQAKFASLAKSTRRDAILEAKIEMARFGVQWEGIRDPLKEIKLLDITLLDDSLTEFQFLKQVWFIIRAQVLMQQVIFKMVKMEQPNGGANQLTSDKEGPQT